MSSKYNHDDSFYKNLVKDSISLGNALLADIVIEKIAEKKRKIAKTNFTTEFLNYKNELDKLRALKIAYIHSILNEKSLDELDLHIEAAEKLISKIHNTLNDHVKLDASGIITKGELEYLNKNKTVIESISGDLQDVPDIAAASHLSEIEDFKKSLNRIQEIIGFTIDFVNESRKNVMNDTSKVIDCLQ